MEKNEIIEFLRKIDTHLAGEKFELKIIGKSALLLAGLKDTVGTVDIDSLSVEGTAHDQKNVRSLEAEFGRAKVTVNGYYLEFVPHAIVFLPQKPRWTSLTEKYATLTVQYLEPTIVIASKMFSAFASPPRKKDKQDIVAALDQGLVKFQETITVADQIFDCYSMDSRADRFPAVYAYITNDLVKNYGQATLKYEPPEE